VTVWRADHLREITGGRWLAAPSNRDMPVAGLSIDSRTIEPGEVFLALKGERFDGHDFIHQAVERGASMVIVEPGAPIVAGAPMLETLGALGALGAIATAHRRTLTGARVICVTGSNGKTTTCRLLETTLGLELPGIASVKSFNNHIGLPLTLLRATREHRFIICETGTSGPGEIAALTSIARPDIALITSVGRAHLEKLIDLAGVAREKASIARGLGPGGLLLATFDSPELRAELAAGALAGRSATFGRTVGADHRIESVEPTLIDDRDGVAFRLDGAPFEVTLTGEHNASNAAATALVARALGIGDETIGRGLRQAAPAPMRMQRSVVRGVTLWNDAYNANPESMVAAAGDFLARAPEGARRVLVMGDMLELGAGAEGTHEEVGRRIGALGRVDLLCCVGGLARSIGVGLTSAQAQARVEAFDLNDGAAPARIASLLAPGDWALLKGSRATRLERVEEALRGAAEHTDAPVGAGDA